METWATRSGGMVATPHTPSTTTLQNESFGEVGLSLMTMSGALSGAIGGMMLGAEVGSVFPVVCGMLGTLFGGGLLAGAWTALESWWNRGAIRNRVELQQEHATEPNSPEPVPNLS